MRSRSEADRNNGMVMDYHREGYYSSVTWLSYNVNKVPNVFMEQLNEFFSKYVYGGIYKPRFEVSIDSSIYVSRVFKTLFISRTKCRKP